MKGTQLRGNDIRLHQLNSTDVSNSIDTEVEGILTMVSNCDSADSMVYNALFRYSLVIVVENEGGFYLNYEDYTMTGVFKTFEKARDWFINQGCNCL